MDDVVKAVNDRVVMHLDGQFPAAVEAAGREIDGTDNGADSVGKEQLGVKLESLQLVNLDADVIQDAQAADALDELLLLELVRRPGHARAPSRRDGWRAPTAR